MSSEDYKKQSLQDWPGQAPPFLVTGGMSELRQDFRGWGLILSSMSEVELATCFGHGGCPGSGLSVGGRPGPQERKPGPVGGGAAANSCIP